MTPSSSLSMGTEVFRSYFAKRESKQRQQVPHVSCYYTSAIKPLLSCLVCLSFMEHKKRMSLVLAVEVEVNVEVSLKWGSCYQEEQMNDSKR